MKQSPTPPHNGSPVLVLIHARARQPQGHWQGAKQIHSKSANVHRLFVSFVAYFFELLLPKMALQCHCILQAVMGIIHIRVHVFSAYTCFSTQWHSRRYCTGDSLYCRQPYQPFSPSHIGCLALKRTVAPLMLRVPCITYQCHW